MQVHRDIMDGRFVHRTLPFGAGQPGVHVSPQARIEAGAVLEGPCFVDEGTIVKTGARLGPYAVVGRQCHIEEHAAVDHAIVWANSRVSQEAVVRRSILGRHVHVGRSASVMNGAVLGDKSVVTDYSRL
jgi:NDP-sugar pyrophosphorylase family protein